MAFTLKALEEGVEIEFKFKPQGPLSPQYEGEEVEGPGEGDV